jgi:methylene-tetrahydrofolate reductase-like protein
MWHHIKNRGLLYRLWYYLERRGKETVLDCSMCGQCVARSTALVCPMQCPKQLRNGPCGGSMDGKCEVYPERACIWTKIHKRSDKGWLRKLTGDKRGKILPAVDWSLFGSSAWLNIYPEKKIDVDGNALSHTPEVSGNLWAALGEKPCCKDDSPCCCGGDDQAKPTTPEQSN